MRLSCSISFCTCELAVRDGYAQVLIRHHCYRICHLPTWSQVHWGSRGTPCLSPQGSPRQEMPGLWWGCPAGRLGRRVSVAAWRAL